MTATLVEFKPTFPKKQKVKTDVKNWKSPKEIAEIFRTTEATVSRWGTQEENPLPRKKIGRKVLIDVAEAEKWLELNSTQY